MGNCITLPQIFNVKQTICIDNTESKQSRERISMTQEKTTTVAVDTTMVMNHTTINTKREFHSEETSSYWLPKDEEEQQRLTAISKLLFFLN